MSAVDLDLAKEFLQITGTAQDTTIQALLDGAEEWVSAETGCHVYSSGDGSHTEDLDGGNLALTPTYLPVLSVASVLDTEDDNRALTGTVKITPRGTRILYTTDGEDWPEGLQRWRVAYTGGYSATTLPDKLQELIIQLLYRAYWAPGGKVRQASGGYGFDFGALVDSDLYRKIKLASLKGCFG